MFPAKAKDRNIFLLHIKKRQKTGTFFGLCVLFVTGIHAREWICPALSTWILNQLLTSTEADIRFIAENFDWYVFPSTNPDGYQYSHTTVRM